MPFGCLFKKDKAGSMSEKEQHTKLGLKVVMAQQNPQPVYDLTDCAMVELPPDTFVMCKLLHKTVLLLQNNLLTGIDKGGKLQELESLEVLDVSHNKISHLPDDISKMKNMKVLKVGNNKLKSLPSSISELKKLQELDLSSNKFSKVPLSICALPKLRVLFLSGNKISELPKEFCNLQKSLKTLEIEVDRLHSPPPSGASGVEAVMKFVCEKYGVPYEGASEDGDSPEHIASLCHLGAEQPGDDPALIKYLQQKDENLKAQMAVSEACQAREQEQLAQILQDLNSNKQHLLEGILETPVQALEYERKKLAMLQEQYNIEESMRAEQAEQLEQYLATSSNKEALISDLSAQQANLDLEVEGLVSLREKDRQKLLKDLTSAEQVTAAALHELLSAASTKRSEEFVEMIQDQEKNMQLLLSGIAEAKAELKTSDVIEAMKTALVEEAMAEQRRKAVEEEQGMRVCALLTEAELVDDHLRGVLTARMADQQEWVDTLLQDEQCQAVAFKLLLLKSDLQRNNILRQIGQIEYELVRLTSLEMRKKKHGVKYGSSTMLEQRATLAGLLKSLLMEKSEREAHLTAWLQQLQDTRSSDVDEEEYWLIQYQRLLSVKPAGLAEAEDKLEPPVQAVLKAANALDLVPVFAHNSITFAKLKDMSEEEAAGIGIGPATYRSLQRALQSYLSASKLGQQMPSPCDDKAPSAPEFAEKLSEADAEAPSAPPSLNDNGASAPPLEQQFLEAECVICLDASGEVIFLPCGHVCVCAKCCPPLAICPMCRAPIISKILRAC